MVYCGRGSGLVMCNNYHFDSKMEVTVEIYANVCGLYEREDGTVAGWWISGVYDVNGNIRTEWKFPKGYVGEAVVQPDNTIVIKFAP